MLRGAPGGMGINTKKGFQGSRGLTFHAFHVYPFPFSLSLNFETVTRAGIAILAASVVSGLLGYLWLVLGTKPGRSASDGLLEGN